MNASQYATRDVSAKGNTLRSAKAAAEVLVSSPTIEAIRSGTTPKADPLSLPPGPPRLRRR
jgi:molybdenum cofactor biosynthesis enzyme